jgi:hypothetical protein
VFFQQDTHRKQKRQAVLLAGEHTFESVFNAWIEPGLPCRAARPKSCRSMCALS